VSLSVRLTNPDPRSVVIRRTGLSINGQPEIVVEIDSRRESWSNQDYIAIQGSEGQVIETFRQAWNKLVNLPDRSHEITDPESERINEQLAEREEAGDAVVGLDRNPQEPF
jgi:hypothetical protein